MRCDDETTATQLHERLIQHGISLCLRTVLSSRELLGWTYRGSAYCLIRDVNKQKRLEWALHQNDYFENVIFSDEASIQIGTHRLQCYRKKGELPKPKPRPKHPAKVHVWTGISKQGATSIAIFTGIMDAAFYVFILDCCLTSTVLNIDSCRITIQSMFHAVPSNFFEENNKLVTHST